MPLMQCSITHSPGAPKVDVQDLLGQSRKENLSSTSSSLPATSTDPTEKKLFRLQKKLQQVQSLKEKLAKGEKLEANQV